jgi:NTF2-related export protein 1/2
MDTAVLVWNGSSVAGNMVIQAFLEKLPVSDHQIVSLDAQPVHGMLKHFEFFFNVNYIFL